ncbi:ABC transporter substrate-binding protein [Pelagibacterium halotolerans]
MIAGTANGEETRTQYPLTIENCGQSVTFESAPQNAVALGQNSAEILLLLGLEERLAATAFWPNEILPELEEAHAKATLLTVEFPTLEAVLGQSPDFVAAQLPTLLGPDSRVAKRDDFENLGIPTYLSPSVCLERQAGDDAYGSRAELWNMDLLFQEIDELSQIFDVADRGQALIAEFRAREAALRERFVSDPDLSFIFWFSSPSPADDAYLGGGNSASSYIADLLGGHNAITVKTEWPTVSWESIIAADPKVLVVAQVDRNRWELDNAENKIAWLENDPTVSQIRAVREGRLLVMPGASMNPTIRTIYGAEALAWQLEQIGAHTE